MADNAQKVLSNLIGSYEVRTSFITTVSSPELILPANPQRWAIIFSESAGMTVAPVTSVAGGVPGFSLATRFPITVRDFGPLPMVEWYCFGVVGLQVSIIEVIKL